MEQTIEISGVNIVIVSILVLALGKFLNEKINLLSRFNIPLAVSGGLFCSVLTAILYGGWDIAVEFDMGLRNLLLLTFFSTVGLSAKLSTLVSGGRTLIILLAFAVLLLVMQDVAGIFIALLLDAKPAYGLFAGSISFAGGHGTAIAWGQLAEDAGLPGAGTLGLACATFGLVAGGLIGGPIGGYLVNKHKLGRSSDDIQPYEVAEGETPAEVETFTIEGAFTTLLLLALCVGLGHNVNDWLSGFGVSLPPFLTAMFVGIVLTNISSVIKMEVDSSSINRAGEISLHLFLAMSLMSVQLWQLASAIGPLLLVLFAQMLVISIIAVFLVFRFLGRDYDASVMAAGFLGLGLGATPVAMANMQAITGRFGPSPKAFIVVPLVGAFFLDLSNAIIINTFASLPLLQEGLTLPVP